MDKKKFKKLSEKYHRSYILGMMSLDLFIYTGKYQFLKLYLKFLEGK